MERLLVELHLHMLRGEEAAVQADHVRDLMEIVDYDLTEDERDLVESLSADLYMIGGEEFVTLARRRELSGDNVRLALQAFDLGHWENCLYFLRGPHKGMDESQLVGVREVCWRGLGFELAANCFKGYGESLSCVRTRTELGPEA